MLSYLRNRLFSGSWSRLTKAYHPEGFPRGCSYINEGNQRRLPVCERLINFANVLLYSTPYVPAFVSTSSYFYQVSNGVTILAHGLKEYNDDYQNAIYPYLCRPLGDLSKSLSRYIELFVNSKERQRSLRAFCRQVAVRHVAMDVAAYWSRPDVQAQYGPYSVIYRMFF